MLNEEVITKAETAAIQIPAGNALILPEGSRIYITQMLGNSITAATDMGLVRIAREEAARAGIIPDSEVVQESDDHLTLEERVWKALGQIYDPEIPVDIVNLGLVYGVEVIPQPEGGSQVNVQMTLTAPGCGMGPHLMAEAEMNIAALDGVKNVDVEFVWDPPWNQNMMTEEARMQLGME
ncbi:MAG: iron-sulfur cluster assembly protein [Akkermansia sp.]